MQRLVHLFAQHGELEVIEQPLDIYLEIPHLAYLEAKKPLGGKALLFTSPFSKVHNKRFSIPVFMNIFGSARRCELIFGRNVEEISQDLFNLLEISPPRGFRGILNFFKQVRLALNILPKKQFFSPAFKHKIIKGEEINLYDLPILTTWERDASAFITMGGVYTQSLDGQKKNLGLYRLQVHDKNHLGLHWQIHKDSQHFFHEYKKAGAKMPVSIALGGDPLYIWCGQAPLPYGMYELMLYGFIRGKRARVSPCVSNPLLVPSDSDIVIEGWVDTSKMKLEGPFGDHTGFYTPAEFYPVLEVSAICLKPHSIFPATVVGKPPLEDKYMGKMTERIFLPFLSKISHGLKDMYMPENGVFHNLIFIRLDKQYPGHAKQIMHSLFGSGQMSFVKTAILVGMDAPSFEDPYSLVRFILNHLDVTQISITEGICDALDHGSDEFGYGGKMGVDISENEIEREVSVLSNEELCFKMSSYLDDVRLVVQYFIDTKMPISIVGVKKTKNLPHLFTDLGSSLSEHLGVVVFVDFEKNDLYNLYMLIWRVTGNIDAKRDIRIIKDVVLIDATDKGELDSYPRLWPKETDCNKNVLKALEEKGLLKGVDKDFLKRYHIYNSPRSDEICQI